MRTKNSIRDLALFGGRPTFDDKLHVGRPNIGRRESFLERVNAVLDRRWLTNDGPCVKELEHKAAQFLNVRNFIAVCNGTVALELAIRALELKGEVIIPSFTFVATAHALKWQEIIPVFCDIDPSTHSIDARKAEGAITSRTTGIIGVHVWGNPSPIDELHDIAKRHDLQLLFDAAHAFGCSYKGRSIGCFGHAEVFSFHATKFFNTLEGGAIATNDDELAARLRLMRNFGFAGYDNVVYLGTNGKMNEISAAMGLTGLESIDDFIHQNAEGYRQYLAELQDVPGVRMFRYNEREKCNYQYIVLEVDESTGLRRDELMEILWAENVLARRYFHPGCHKMEPYRSMFPEVGNKLPETEKLSNRVLVLPAGTAVGSSEIRQICHIISFATAHAKDLRPFLDERKKSSSDGPIQ